MVCVRSGQSLSKDDLYTRVSISPGAVVALVGIDVLGRQRMRQRDHAAQCLSTVYTPSPPVCHFESQNLSTCSLFAWKRCTSVKEDYMAPNWVRQTRPLLSSKHDKYKTVKGQILALAFR